MLLLIIISILGIGFANLLPKNIENFYKILIAPSIGLFVFTNLIIVFSFIFGVRNLSIIFSLTLSFFFSLVVSRLSHNSYNIKSFPVFFSFIALAITALFSYILFNQILSPSNEGLNSGGGGIYGDSALHAAYTSRLETGQFPPQNPLYAGRILVYPFANDLLSAVLRIAGLNFNFAFVLPQILFFIAFLSLFYQVAKKFTQDLGFVISLIILLLGWGVGSFFFLNELSKSSLGLGQLLSIDYTHIEKYNLYLHNIITGLILPERSFLPGLVLGLLIFLNFFEYKNSKKLRFLALNGIILGFLPFWHTHTFIFYSLFSVFFSSWILIEKTVKKTVQDLLIMFSIALVAASPFLVLFFLNHDPSNFIRFTFGWQRPDTENIIVFWFKNSLLTIPLALLGLFFVKRHKLLFFAPAFITFIIANLVIFQPWEWDNIKLLSWSFLFFAILVAIVLVKIIEKNIVWKLLVLLIVITSISSGSLSVINQLKNRFIVYNKEDIALAKWTKINTKIDDIFIIETKPNHPIPGLAGRLVYIGYPGHLWVHGIDYSKREQQNNKILAGDFSPFYNLEVPISYIVISNKNIRFEDNMNLKSVYKNRKYEVFKKI